MQDIKKQIEDYFSLHKEEIYEKLRTLMELESVTSDRQCCREALRYVAELAASFGMRTVIGRHGDVAVAEIGEGELALGILAHVDVVDIGNRGAWIYEPYTLTVADGTLYGRGIADDKGSVILSLYAMRYLKETLPGFNKRIQLIIGTSEEDNWVDMAHYKEEFELPDYGYSPDGNFPVYNSENGYMDIVLRFEQQLPSEYDDFRCGSASNSIPSEGQFSRNGELFYVSGRAAHSSTPQLGENAMLRLAEKLKDSSLDFSSFLLDYFPEGEYGSRLPIERVETDIPREARLKTTIVPTLMGQDGRAVWINFNVRNAFDMPAENIRAAFEKLKDKYHYQIRIDESLAPIYTDSKRPWLNRMKEVYESYGLKNEFLPGPGCSYAKAIPGFVCWGPVFPGDPDTAHMENEQVPETSFMLSAAIYTEYLYREAGCEADGTL